MLSTQCQVSQWLPPMQRERPGSQELAECVHSPPFLTPLVGARGGQEPLWAWLPSYHLQAGGTSPEVPQVATWLCWKPGSREQPD